jgi:glycerol-3-phosphate acyltransferase PlsY
MMTMEEQGWAMIALAAVVGYLIGSISPAGIVARLRGVDLRAVGSGNPGATNVSRALGRSWGVAVGVLDVLKGLLPALAFAQVALGLGEVAGFAAVLGHITSPWLRGRGGKGVATALGALLGTQWVWALLALAGFAVGYAVFRRMGLGAVCAAVVLIGCGVVAAEPSSRLFGVALGLTVALRHISNVTQYLQERRERGRPAAQ